MRRYFSPRIVLALAGTAFFSLAQAQGLPAGTTAFSPGVADDKTSWAVFISAITPVAAGSGWPAGTLTYETWATDNDTYGPNAPHWPSPASPPSIRFQASALGLHGPTGLRALKKAPGDTDNAGIPPSVSCNPVGNAAAGNFPTNVTPPPANCASEEVRRNLLAFNYIAGMIPGAPPIYTDDQLKASAKSGPKIDFPSSKKRGEIEGAAIEVKVDWVPVGTVVAWLQQNGVPKADTDYVMANYFTTQQTAGTPPVTTTYAMLSMHINLKDRPNWLWGTFEHQMNPGRCDTMGCYDDFGMKGGLRAIPPNATTANTIYPACTGKTEELETMFKAAGIGTGSVWNNYCLKSTQVDFTVASGTRLPGATASAAPPGAPLAILSGDSVVERIVANVSIANSSCITCHSYAAFTKEGAIQGKDKNTCNPGLINGSGPIGKHEAALIPGQKQYDFVWAMINIGTTNQNCTP